jgi:hypothetical protein
VPGIGCERFEDGKRKRGDDEQGDVEVRRLPLPQPLLHPVRIAVAEEQQALEKQPPRSSTPPELPPNQGRMTFVIIRCTWNSRHALRKMVSASVAKRSAVPRRNSCPAERGADCITRVPFGKARPR